MTFDAAVIGAGPAGAVAARDLARAGARVALIDGSHPREKPCGGGVTERAARLAGVSVAGGASIETVQFETGSSVARVSLPDATYLRVYARERFDLALVRAAAEAGAHLIGARAASLSREHSGWEIRTSNGAIHAHWVLGADGAGGIVRKQVARPFDRRQLSIAAGSYVDDVETREVMIAFVEQPRGYLWSFPR